MMERRTQAILDRLDDLVPLSSQRRQSGVDPKEPSREATRETEANFGEPIAGKRTDAPVTGRRGSSQYTMGTEKLTSSANGHRGGLSRHAPSMGSRPMRDSQAMGRGSISAGNHSNQRRPSQGSPSNRFASVPQMSDHPDNYEPLHRSLEKFITRLSRTNERSEGS